jgi:hypothetical protein
MWCAWEQLFRALNRRDVFASPSSRWADPRARLLDGKRWEAVSEDVRHGLSLDEPVEEHLAGRVRALDAAWQLMAERLDEAGQNAKLSGTSATASAGRSCRRTGRGAGGPARHARGLVLNAAVLWTTAIWKPPSSSCGRCPPKHASTTC